MDNNTKIRMNQINGIPGDSFNYSFTKFKSIYTNIPILKFIPIILIIDFFFVSLLHVFPQASLVYFLFFVLKAMAGPDWTGLNSVAELSFLRRKKAVEDFKTKDYDELKQIYDFNSEDGTDKETQNKINKYHIINYLINFVVYGLITFCWIYFSFLTGLIISFCLFCIFCKLL